MEGCGTPFKYDDLQEIAWQFSSSEKQFRHGSVLENSVIVSRNLKGYLKN